MTDRVAEVEEALAQGAFDGNAHKAELEELVIEVKRLRADVEVKQDALIVADEALEPYALSDEDTERFAAGLRSPPKSE